MNGDVPPGSHMKHKKFSNKNKAKVQVALLDDTVVAFEVEVIKHLLFCHSN